MKTKVNKKQGTSRKYGMIAILALLTMMALSVTTAPAMAGTPRVSDYARDLGHDGAFMRIDSDHIRSLLPLLDDVLPGDDGSDGVGPAVEHDDPITDGGGWEPCFPDDAHPDFPIPDDVIPDAGDDDATEDCVDEEPDDTDEPADDADHDDEVTDEGDEPADEGEESDDVPTLPFTGGDNIPWMIAGAGIVLAGVVLLGLRRRGRDER